MIFGRPALALASVCVAGVACGADRPNPPNAAARPPLDSAGVSAPSLQPTPPRPWWDKEFGIGVVRYAAMYRYQAKDVIRAAPSAGASIIALLNRDSLCFTGDRCVRSYNRMIEFDYGVPGWAILRFSDDSAWVQVTLAPSDSAAAVGWVALRADSVQALLWSRILPWQVGLLHAPERCRLLYSAGGFRRGRAGFGQRAELRRAQPYHEPARGPGCVAESRVADPQPDVRIPRAEGDSGHAMDPVSHP